MSSPEESVDVVLVGAGIVSATLAAMLAEVVPGLSIRVLERLPGIAQESSDVMNNAGTGHAANCELNYTPAQPDGTVDIAKALAINEAFEVSLQLWAYLAERGRISPERFLTRIPHLSFVWGEADTRFLRARHTRLSAHPMFAEMAFSEDPARLAEWMPLVMEGRETGQPLAATRIQRATDLNFGVLARQLFASLEGRTDFRLFTSHHVEALDRLPDRGWRVNVRDLGAGGRSELTARFVFLGAGGGALPLLLKSGIPEADGYGGFPVSGQWLVCSNPEVIARHRAKVYGKAALGAPPMSVPHLDTRMVEGRPALLFGPYAGFSTKYLKEGSYLDLPLSLRGHNLRPMLAAGWHNLDLTRYLVGQVLQSWPTRMRALRDYLPTAQDRDWSLAVAGQRVQIIKRDPKQGGKLEFGTELVTAADGSLAALLGASPGASTAASTMVGLIQRCVPEQASRPESQAALRAMIPSHGHCLAREPELLRTVRDRTTAVLGLGPGKG
jgi:malate dehydrogenase (quinone)